ncbi:MAG TPA: ROK family protein [Acidimicrobiales bacterium]|nr:ROK family protein [Acidimicrobiales bacterium]
MSAAGGPTVGIDVGGTKLLGVVLSAAGDVLHERRLPTPTGAESVVASLAELVAQLDEGSGTELPVGVGAPGLVDSTGRVLFAPNLPGVRDFPLAQRLSATLDGRPVVVDNDATCAGLGEVVHGVAQGTSYALMVTLGTGIGGGIVMEGRPLRGANGFAGEFGHMVVDPSGPLCPCGRRGCWERYASGSGLGRLAREAAHAGQGRRLVAMAGGDPEAVRGEHVTAAAAEGDTQARAVIERFAWWLAMGLANLANAFDPEVIVIGGGLIESAEVLMEATRSSLVEQVEAGPIRPLIRLEAAGLGERAGAVGAAVMARPGDR